MMRDLLHRYGGWATVVGIVLAVALRGYPLFSPHLGWELQEFYPRNAVIALVQGDWKPWALIHGAGLFDALRAVYTVGFGLGTLLGRFGDRFDVLGAFVQDPMPFVVAGRVVVLAASLVTVLLAAVLAGRLGGRLAAGAAAVVLATCFIHVRETLNVWPDVLTGAAALATILLALDAAGNASLRAAMRVGVAAGVALACKHAVALLAFPVLIALAGGYRDMVRRLAVAGLATIVVYFVLCPYTILDWTLLQSQIEFQSAAIYGHRATTIVQPFGELVVRAFGVGPLLLAAIGVVAAAILSPRRTLIAASFPLIYLGSIAIAENPFARYLSIAAPFVAVFAGVGVDACARRLRPTWSAIGATLLVAVACAGPALDGWHHVRLLRRADTRQLAATWLQANVPAGTAITLPNLAIFPNPVLPPDVGGLGWELAPWKEQLVARGFLTVPPTYEIHHLGFLENHDLTWEPRDPVVVTTSHPAPVGFRTPPAIEERLRRAGYTVATRFTAIVEPPPAGVAYDPNEAGYVPLYGAVSIDRPGPNLTVWRRDAR